MANRAVLVGVMANSDLSGCVNDVTSVSLKMEDGRGKMEATTKNILK